MKITFSWARVFYADVNGRRLSAKWWKLQQLIASSRQKNAVQNPLDSLWAQAFIYDNKRIVNLCA
jgi:hypothetical protein